MKTKTILYVIENLKSILESVGRMGYRFFSKLLEENDDPLKMMIGAPLQLEKPSAPRIEVVNCCCPRDSKKRQVRYHILL